jgi:hypothetical protein
MVVLLPNVALTVQLREHPLERDARGRAVPSVSGDVFTTRGPFPGNAVEDEVDSNTWRLRVDLRLGPIRPGDLLSDTATERVWVVQSVVRHEVPGAPDVDHYQVEGTLEPPAVP